jgi:type IV pilus assembly protein PilM
MPRTVVGLDIGRTAVRAVELRRGRRPVVRRHGRVPLPVGAVEAGLVVDAAAVTAALRQLWREQKIASRQVRLGVGSGSVLVRPLELDWMPPADLRRALRYQVADLLPVAVDDANLDHVLLGEDEQVDPATGVVRRVVRILLVATARGAVDEMVRCVQAAGLRPVAADLAPLALVRAAVAAQGEPAGSEQASTQAVIDIGADTVSVAVHTGGVPHFVRVSPGVGGDALTRALSEESGLDWPAAEQHKRAAAGDTALDPALGPVLDAATQRLLGEVRTTLDFHAATDPAHVPTHALLSGGAGHQRGFLEQCAGVLGLPVQRLDLGASLGLPGDDGYDLALPGGLCLGRGA